MTAAGWLWGAFAARAAAWGLARPAGRRAPALAGPLRCVALAGAAADAVLLLAAADAPDAFGPLWAGLAAGPALVAAALAARPAPSPAGHDLAELFAEMGEAIDEVFWVADPATFKAVYVSPAFARVWGRPFSAIAGPNDFLDTVHPDDREAVRRSFREDAPEVEYRIVRPDGGVRRVVDRKYVVAGPDGSPRRVVGVARDVTAERAAEELNARLAAIVENTPDVVSWATPDGVIRYLNRAGLALEAAHGTPPGQSLGAALAECHPPDVRAMLAEVALPAAALHGSWSGESALQTPAGRRIPVSQVILAHKGPSGAPEFFSTIVRDMSAQRATEERLRASEAQVRAILAALPDIVLVLDAADRFEQVHARRPELLIAPADVLRGRTLSEIIPQPLADDFAAATRRARDGAGVVSLDYAAPTAAGRLWFEARVAPLDETGRVLSVVRDITDRKRAEEALARQAEELARSNAELERFATVASHDLQEPLRMVVSCLELLAGRQERAGDPDPRAAELLRTARDGTVRMRRLITDLLTYSRVQTRERTARPVDLNTILAGVVQDLGAALREKGGEVSVGPLPTLRGDPTQFTQLFQNLVGNAVKFCDAPPRVEVSAERAGGEWLLCVRDNGIGVPAADRGRIFEVFSRLHPAARYGGSGVGLAICRRVAERHGGRVWCDAAPGGGSVFRVAIPTDGAGERSA